MSEELKTAIAAAKKAAAHATKFLENDFEVMRKDDDSPVTKADKECEKIIRSTITEKFPNAKFVGEEGGGNTEEEEFWIIDPIDGTKAFARNIPHWSILIALYKNNDIHLGVSFIAGQNQLFYAERGKGAFLNDEKVHVSSHEKLDHFYFTFGTPKRVANIDGLLRLIDKAEWARSVGDAMSFHLLANGKTDVHIENGLQLWDIAPFKVIIEEAGGKITEDTGEPWSKTTSNILVSNGLLHDEAVRLFNQK